MKFVVIYQRGAPARAVHYLHAQYLVIRDNRPSGLSQSRLRAGWLAGRLSRGEEVDWAKEQAAAKAPHAALERCIEGLVQWAQTGREWRPLSNWILRRQLTGWTGYPLGGGRGNPTVSALLSHSKGILPAQGW